MSQGDARKMDPETLLALHRARRSPNRRAVGLLIGVIVLVVGLALIAWLVSLDVGPAALTLAAYDAVATPEQDIELRARLDAEDSERPPDLASRELLFQVAQTQTSQQAATAADGTAGISWKAPRAGGRAVEFLVRHLDPGQNRALRDTGRVFVWPESAALLVVDADHALADADEETLQSASTAALKLKEGAAAALRTLAGQHRVVYLTAVMDRPASYRKLRAWLRQGAAAGQGQLPDGPLLGPVFPLGEGDRALFAIGQIEKLKQSFPKPAVGIAGRSKEARMFLDAGWKTFLIGEEQGAPAGAMVVPSWTELAKRLKQDK
jgi:hypothetical protein